MGLEADSDAVLVSVYRTAPSATVAVHERRVELQPLREALRRALAEAAKNDAAPRALAAARTALAAPWPSFGRAALARVSLRVNTPDDEPLSIHSEARFRARPARVATAAASDETHLERSDLHALLARGSVKVRAGAAEIGLSATFPLLVAERLLSLADEALVAWRDERPLFRRAELDGAQIAVRRTPGETGLVLRFLSASGGKETGPALAGIDPRAFARAAARFALGLEAAFVSSDPAQGANLRLQHLSREARALERAVTSLGADDSLTNADPDSYRSFGLPRRPTARGKWEHGGRMRFFPRWVASVPQIDLGATFQCGDRLLVSSPRQTACLDRATGTMMWRRALPRAASVPTPIGLVRLQHDGTVTLHDLDRGEARFTLHLAPRAAAARSGRWSTRPACRACSHSPKAIAPSPPSTSSRATSAGATPRRARPPSNCDVRAGCCSWQAATRRSSRWMRPPVKSSGACGIACPSPPISRSTTTPSSRRPAARSARHACFTSISGAAPCAGPAISRLARRPARLPCSRPARSPYPRAIDEARA